MAEDPAALEVHDEAHRAGRDDQGGRGRAGPDALQGLVSLLNEHRVTAVPVLDDAGQVVVGVVSESDLALKEVAPLREAHTPPSRPPSATANAPRPAA